MEGTMKLIDRGDTHGMMFVLSNKDLKAIKRSHKPVGFEVVRGDKKSAFSFISEVKYEQHLKDFKKQEEAVKEHNKQAMESNKDETNEPSDESGATDEKVGVHTES